MKILASLLLLLTAVLPADAARILQNKDSRVLVELEDGESAFSAQKFYLLNSDGKKVALGSVTQVKNNRAILNIEKGKYVAGARVEFVAAVAGGGISADVDESTGEAAAPLAPRGVYRISGVKYSTVFTLTANTMVTKQTDGSNPVPNTEDVNLKGSGIGLTGIMDYPFNDWLTLRGTLGYEPFNASGSSRFLVCDGLTSTDCNAYINYLSAGGYLRFDLTKSRSLMWVGLGGTLKQPLSKKTTALLAEDIKLTMTLAAAFGLDYFISNKTFIPVSLEYQMFQNSDTVSANLIMLRAGYGWSF